MKPRDGEARAGRIEFSMIFRDSYLVVTFHLEWPLTLSWPHSSGEFSGSLVSLDPFSTSSRGFIKHAYFRAPCWNHWTQVWRLRSRKIQIMSSSGHPKTLGGKTPVLYYRRNCTGLGTDHLGLKAYQCLSSSWPWTPLGLGLLIYKMQTTNLLKGLSHSCSSVSRQMWNQRALSQAQNRHPTNMSLPWTPGSWPWT